MKFILHRLTSYRFLFIAFALLPIDIIGQDESEYFGKLKKSNWPAEKCPIDTHAAAYYLFDKGHATFNPSDQGWTLSYERFFRIKINTNNGLSHRKQILWLKNKGNEGNEKIVELKSNTYTINNKKIVSTTIIPIPSAQNNSLSFARSRENHNSFISVDSSDAEWTSVEFNIPNVKAGSVIDVYYKIHSNLFFDFPNWQFQRDIPVLFSEYYTLIPEYFHYVPILKGVNKINRLMVVRNRYLYSFMDTINQYTATDIPALSDLPYVNNINDHTSSLDFEFAGYKYGTKSENYLKTWNEITKDLMRDTAFGVQSKRCNSYDAFVLDLNKQKATELEKLNTCYQHIKDVIKWNGAQGLKAEIPIDSVYKYKSGTAAEINLSLICLLKKSGLDAKPLISSTIDHGLVQRSVPSEKWFNYTTAVVNIGGKQYILDAADPWSNQSFLPPYLNGYGKVIDTLENSWIEISANGIFQNQVNYNLSLDPGKGLTGTYQSRDLQYAAYLKRKSMQDSIDEKNYFDDLNYRHPHITLFDTKVENKNEINKELLTMGALHLFNQFKEKDGRLHWIPMQYERILENPFKSLQREIPVEFPYPSMQNVIMEIKIPDNYEVESLPKSVRLANEDNSSRYVFLTEQTENTIKLNSLLSIRKPVYSAAEYPNLKEFLNRVVQKQAEPIILKRK